MSVILALFVAMVGWFAGYFLSTAVLWVITTICAVITIYAIRNFKEMAVLITVVIIFCAVIGNLLMWGTHYVANDQHWLGDFFRTYVVR